MTEWVWFTQSLPATWRLMFLREVTATATMTATITPK
jgi:hypothetical protein